MFLEMELDALQYIFLMKQAGVNIAAINVSYGGYGWDPFEQAAFEMIASAGIIVAASAGNDGIDNDMDPLYPASYDLDNIISVAATGWDDEMSLFSNYGLTSVDLGAPGDAVMSTVSQFWYMPGEDPEKDVFFDDMDHGSDQWQDTGTWEITDEKFISPPNAWSDSPGGPYTENTVNPLTSVPINLQDAEGPLWFVFGAQFELEPLYDWLDVYFSRSAPSLWGRTTENPRSGLKSWSDSPYGNYPDNANSWLVSPTVDISTASPYPYPWPLFSFHITGEIEYDWDFLEVYFSRDGGETWYLMYWVTGTINGWQLFTLPIYSFFQTDQFRAAFVLRSDFIFNYDGYYIDDVTIRDWSGTLFSYDMESEDDGWMASDMTVWDYMGSLTGFSGEDIWFFVTIPIDEQYFWDGFQVRFEVWANEANNYDGVYLDHVGIGPPEYVQTYMFASGTSMAAPQVAGAVAMVASEFPDESVEERRNRILWNVDPLDSMQGKVATGGRLNLYNCLQDAEMPPERQIALILKFFDISVESGKLEGYGHFSCLSEIRLRLFRMILEMAEFFIEKGLTRFACHQLKRAYKRIDGQPHPRDFVIGDCAPRLAQKILDLRDALGCK